jgi:cysteine desulfurase
MHDVMKNCFGNPSSVHAFGINARAVIDECRETAASLLHVSPSEIFFTSCGTEAINMVITGCCNDLGIRRIITSPIEHHAVMHACAHQVMLGNCSVELLSLDNKGNIDLAELENILKSGEPSLVCLMHANNEIGNLLPLQEIGDICKKYNAYFLCDTVQSIAKFKHDFKKMNIHFAACSAHKFHGPKGIGFLYLDNNIKISPLLQGGGQERNMRPGTENIYGIAGLAKAMEVAYRNLDADVLFIKELKAHMVQRLKDEISDVQFNGESEVNGLHTILNVSFPETKRSEMLLYNLDIEGIAASGGSACTSGSVTESHVLKAIGANMKRTSIRFSFSKFNTKHEVDKCIEVIKKVS